MSRGSRKTKGKASSEQGDEDVGESVMSELLSGTASADVLLCKAAIAGKSQRVKQLLKSVDPMAVLVGIFDAAETINNRSRH